MTILAAMRKSIEPNEGYNLMRYVHLHAASCDALLGGNARDRVWTLALPLQKIILGLIFGLVAAVGVDRAGAADYKVDGDRLVVSGWFDGDGEVNRFRALLDQNKQVKVIRFTDMWGTKKMSNRVLDFPALIRRRGLNTEVAGPCISACAIAFVGGVQRTSVATARDDRTYIYFHGSYASGRPILEYFDPYMKTILTYVPQMPRDLLVKAYKGRQGGGLLFFDPRLYRRGDGSSVVMCEGMEANKPRDCPSVSTADARVIGLFTH